MKTIVLEPVSIQECCLVTGGVDKNAQNALYYIGYAVGFLVKCIIAVLSFKGRQAFEGQ
ncbi:MAG: hypothetical protein IJR25_03275 [Bacteroidales bacterium]|nr:hypothetical protein [Bacteroidales bacterium]